MPKRKEPELTPAEQKKRFEALARELDIEKPATREQVAKNLRQMNLARRAQKPKR